MAKNKLSKAQEEALAYVEAAETMEELRDAVGELSAEEKNDKRIGYPVYLATQRIVGQSVPLPR